MYYSTCRFYFNISTIYFVQPSIKSAILFFVTVDDHQIIHMKSRCVLFFIHLSVCNTDGIRIKLKSLFFDITPKSFVLYQRFYQHPIQSFQHLDVQYFASIFIHNIGSIKFWWHFHQQFHYHSCNLHNNSWFVFFCLGHIRLDKIIGGI